MIYNKNDNLIQKNKSRLKNYHLIVSFCSRLMTTYALFKNFRLCTYETSTFRYVN